jgi:plasmid stability protein
MATLTLSELDDALFQAISDRAAQNSRSVEAEAEDLLRLGLAARAGRERLIGAADAIAEMTPAGAQTDPVELLSEDRSR